MKEKNKIKKKLHPINSNKKKVKNYKFDKLKNYSLMNQIQMINSFFLERKLNKIAKQEELKKIIKIIQTN